MDPNAVRAEAERCIRRGDLREALALYREILASNPQDAATAGRIGALSELLSADGPAAPMPAPFRLATPPPAHTAEQRAEVLFEKGEYPAALAAYDEILRARPDHELARERHREIEALAGAALSPAKAGPSEPPLPRGSRKELLEALLARIATRRAQPRK